MKQEQILIFKNDLAKYPPIITIIKVLLNEGYKVSFWGYCSDVNIIKTFNADFTYKELLLDNVNANKLSKLYTFLKYKKSIHKLLSSKDSKNINLWVFGNQNLWLLNRLLIHYKFIAYLFEMPEFTVATNYKLFCTNKSYKEILQCANKVVCCEYNRAAITKALFNLSEIPFVIPNKPIIESYIPSASSFENKKVILYQGIFNYPERRLDEFCQAIELLPENFILVLMGGPDNKYRNMLKQKYESERVIFLPFMSPPNHLSITQQSYIGLLTYNSTSSLVQEILNLLYCAPNKVYEYALFGVPMISNDLPALRAIFDKYNAGLVVERYDPHLIAQTILEIDSNYTQYQEGAQKVYKSVDVENLIKQLVAC